MSANDKGRGEGGANNEAMKGRAPAEGARKRSDRWLRQTGLNWAESAPTSVASGKTGVRAMAAIPLRAWSMLHRPEPVLQCSHTCRTSLRKRVRALHANDPGS